MQLSKLKSHSHQTPNFKSAWEQMKKKPSKNGIASNKQKSMKIKQEVNITKHLGSFWKD